MRDVLVRRTERAPANTSPGAAGPAPATHIANLVILVTSQLISATGSIVIVTLGGIIGATLSPERALATLPVSMMVVAIAATTVPAALLMRRIGRAQGFALGAASSIAGVLVAVLALAKASFLLFVVAAMLFGINMAFTQQYRYAAAESVAPRHVPRAISFVLLGSIGGALLGPELVTRGHAWLASVPYGGTLLVLAALYAVQALLLLNLEGRRDEAGSAPAVPARPLRTIVAQPVFVVAVLGGTTGYGLMTLLMTATPLSMHVNDGFSLADTAAVIRMHVLGMYVPSLVSGFLIERFGVVRLMLAGAGLFVLTSVAALQGHEFAHYGFALVLLGVAWNFLYVGSTTMLTYTYTDGERYRAQAVNEFMVFGASALASLAAGAVMHWFGWDSLAWLPLALIGVVVVALVIVRRDELLRRPPPVTAPETP
ncbi:MAG TPA: MFS transporter [Woeseiaceae bacterium]|nr:MFS transporter [Woeseiaceae bacterium]